MLQKTQMWYSSVRILMLKKTYRYHKRLFITELIFSDIPKSHPKTSEAFCRAGMKTSHPFTTLNVISRGSRTVHTDLQNWTPPLLFPKKTCHFFGSR